MAIHPISEEEFSENVIRSFTGFTKEYEWFKSDELDIYGVVIKDTIDKDWAYITLARDDDGEFRAQFVESSINTIDTARNGLYQKLISIEATGLITDELYESVETDESILDLPKIEIMTIDDQIKAYFKKHPEELYQLSPRKFEELVASIMRDMGFEVQLTQATRDGGRDIIAFVRNGLTNFLAHVECKRYGPENKVSVDIIRSVVGVHHMRNANKSIIVTTGFYTKSAKEEAKLVESTLDLKDYNDLKVLLSTY